MQLQAPLPVLPAVLRLCQERDGLVANLLLVPLQTLIGCGDISFAVQDEQFDAVAVYKTFEEINSKTKMGAKGIDAALHAEPEWFSSSRRSR